MLKFYYLLFLILFANCKRNHYKELKNILSHNTEFKQKLLDANIPPDDVYHAYKSCAKKSQNIKYMDSTPYTIAETDICRGKVSILVAIHSNNPHREHRNIIRETFGSVARIDGYIIRYAFFVGASRTPEEQQALIEESTLNRDIVQRDFVESYRNMTRKHLTVIEWTVKHCSNAQYLLKTDDDVFIDLYHLVRVIKEGLAETGFLCSGTKRVLPVRNNKGNKKKWFVTKKEFAGKYYPTYCEGYGYLIRIKPNLARIYSCSFFQSIFWIDDVYVGGILPNMLGIPRNSFSVGSGFYFMRPSHASPEILDGIFYVAYWSQLIQNQWHKMWNSVIKYSMAL